MAVTLGSTVQLPCRPGAVWERDGAEMRDGGRRRVGIDGSLVIYNVTGADSGQYQCRVRDPDSRHTSHTTVTTFSVLSDQPARSYSAHTGRVSLTESQLTVEEEYDEQEEDHDTDLSYDVSGRYAGDQHVVRAVQEAQRTVDRALNHTVQLLFERGKHSDREQYPELTDF